MKGSQPSDSRVWETVFRKREEVVSREIAGETILVPIRGKLVDMQRIFSLNPVAAHIWQQLDGERSLAKIRDDVLDTFDVEKSQADADIQEFVGELIEAELIVEAT